MTRAPRGQTDHDNFVPAGRGTPVRSPRPAGAAEWKQGHQAPRTPRGAPLVCSARIAPGADAISRAKGPWGSARRARGAPRPLDGAASGRGAAVSHRHPLPRVSSRRPGATVGTGRGGAGLGSSGYALMRQAPVWPSDEVLALGGDGASTGRHPLASSGDRRTLDA